jgi:thiamine biosynthesis lipoprotein
MDEAARMKHAARWRRAKPLLGTLVEIGVAEVSPRAQLAVAAAFAEIARVHQLMSFHDSGSDVSRLNRAAVGQSVAVDARTREVIRLALELQDASAGAFDITVADLLVAQGTLPDPGGCDTTGDPTNATAAAGPALLLGAAGVKKLRACLIDLGGIAKGYAVDRAFAVLEAAGLEEILVNAGGDLRQRGREGTCVHLRDPEDAARMAGSLWLHNQALASSATSGSAARGLCAAPIAHYDGRVRRALGRGAGVSVTAPTCVISDALTKVVLATGQARHPSLECYGARVVLYRRPASAPTPAASFA